MTGGHLALVMTTLHERTPDISVELEASSSSIRHSLKQLKVCKGMAKYPDLSVNVLAFFI